MSTITPRKENEKTSNHIDNPNPQPTPPSNPIENTIETSLESTLKRLVPAIKPEDVLTLKDDGIDALESLGINDEEDEKSLTFSNPTAKSSVIAIHRCVLTDEPMWSKSIIEMKKCLTNPKPSTP